SCPLPHAPQSLSLSPTRRSPDLEQDITSALEQGLEPVGEPHRAPQLARPVPRVGGLLRAHPRARQAREVRRRGRSELDVRDEPRSEEHTSELQSLTNLVCRLLLE